MNKGSEASSFRPFFINTRMWNSLTRIEAPEPSISVEDVKRHLAIAHADEDMLLGTLIDAATAYIDGPNGAGIALTKQAWRLTLDHLPRCFRLPMQPVTHIRSIKVGGELLSSDHYDFDEDLGELSIKGWHHGRVKIDFEAGYTDIPADLKHAVRMIVGHLYNNREATSNVVIHDVPMAVSSILNRYRVGFI